jgi:hypothetical protein
VSRAGHRGYGPLMTDADMVRTLDQSYQDRAWNRAATVLHPDAVVVMSATERLVGRDAVVDFQRAYPEPWGTLTVGRVLTDAEGAAAQVSVVDPAGREFAFGPGLADRVVAAGAPVLRAPHGGWRMRVRAEIRQSEDQRRYLLRVARQRVFSAESSSWLPPSQIFADTQRIDLFNDPKWETSPSPSRGSRETDGRSRWSAMKAVVFHRAPHKRGQPKRRGQHLKTPA